MQEPLSYEQVQELLRSGVISGSDAEGSPGWRAKEDWLRAREAEAVLRRAVESQEWVKRALESERRCLAYSREVAAKNRRILALEMPPTPSRAAQHERDGEMRGFHKAQRKYGADIKRLTAEVIAAKQLAQKFWEREGRADLKRMRHFDKLVRVQEAHRELTKHAERQAAEIAALRAKLAAAGVG